MKICIKIIVLWTIFVFNQMSATINADYDYYEDQSIYPHQEHRLCDSRHCENTCARPDAQNSPCPFRLCHEGYFCESGYVRELKTDQCILPNDCPPTTNTEKSVNIKSV